MVTKKSLRCALLCLLVFTLFCLVVLELVLNDRHLAATYRQLNSTLANEEGLAKNALRSTISDTVVSPNAGNLTLSHGSGSPQEEREKSQKGANLTGSGTMGDVLQPADAAKQVVNDSQTGPSSSSSATEKANATAAEHSQIRDYCKDEVPAPTVEPSFLAVNPNLTEVPPDGSRPRGCQACFRSDFPPLIQNCGLCNAGGGGEKKAAEGVELVMLILTTHRAADRRDAIRETWASHSQRNTATVRHAFLLGRAKTEEEMQQAYREQEKHGDIIMYDFVDTYANLTLKTLTAMRWVTRFCSQARFVLKADDDMWINVPGLLEACNRHEQQLQTAVGGACRESAGPIRNAASKWYASYKAYPQDSYPGFCSGTSYVTTVNLARHVLAVSPNVPFFYLEDVYVALCIQRLGSPFRLLPISGFFTWGTNCAMKSDQSISMHEVPPQRIRDIWYTKCNKR